MLVLELSLAIPRRAEERAAGGENESEAIHAEKWQRKLAEEAKANAERVRKPG